jgi:hypothetical protein
MRQGLREAAASNSTLPKVHRREGYLATVHIKPVKVRSLPPSLPPTPVDAALGAGAVTVGPGQLAGFPRTRNLDIGARISS